VRVFPDTNVLVSAFVARGLCADVLRLVLGEHELVTGEIVIEELRAVLRRKFAMPAGTLDGIEHLLREYHVEPRPRELPRLKLDRNDLLVVAAALRAAADILITGDQELLNVEPKGLKISSPREFWDIQRQRRPH